MILGLASSVVFSEAFWQKAWVTNALLIIKYKSLTGGRELQDLEEGKHHSQPHRVHHCLRHWALRLARNVVKTRFDWGPQLGTLP